MNKLKDIGNTGLGLMVLVLLLAIPIFFMKGGVWVFENYYGFIQLVDRWVFILVVLLLIFSTIPRIRFYTGIGIYYLTYMWGAIFWLFCLFVTYQYWGLFGIFAGLIMAGVGVFLTAFLAILFDGQIFGAFMIVLNLVIIYAIRSLGYWIASKHVEKAEVQEGFIEPLNN